MALVGAAVTDLLCTTDAAQLAPAAANTGVNDPELDEGPSCSHLACAAANTGAGNAEIVETLLRAMVITPSNQRVRDSLWHGAQSLHYTCGLCAWHHSCSRCHGCRFTAFSLIVVVALSDKMVKW